MKTYLTAVFWVFLTSCATPLVVPTEYKYKEIKTSYFTLASWQKISNKGNIKIYIEGDGNSFDARGMPTKNPTPKGKFLRELAFSDESPNVVYLARPCQFVADQKCDEVFWTTGRFAPEVIYSTADAISQIAKGREIELVGFSGGAQVAGLVACIHTDLKVNRLVNYAPNLDHGKWVDELDLIPLKNSLSLADYQEEFLSFKQTNYIPEEDWVIPPDITINFLKGDKWKYKIIEDVGHNFK